MQQNYETLLKASLRINWRLEDVVGDGKRLDFSRPFLPEAFARTAPLTFLTSDEQLTLNHIRAHGYLAMFELVEGVILPFVVEQANTKDVDVSFRTEALHQFASEEVKHMALFQAFRQEFVAEFGVDCGFIGPAEEISRAILDHSPLAIAILVLGIEWMSQGHYVESVRNDNEFDPQFKSLLRHHWMEEMQHARMDALVLQAMANRHDERDIDRAIDEYLEIGAFIDAGLKQQVSLDLVSFERAACRALPDEERKQFLEVQYQALRWTFLGSAMLNKNFLISLAQVSRAASQRVESAGLAISQQQGATAAPWHSAGRDCQGRNDP
ncbi:MAG: hypothetical protein R3F24_07835 [Gammaproteobacteria bacterium]